MKTIITLLTVITLACSGSALAAEDICKTYEARATSIMEAKQSGVPLSAAMERYRPDPLFKTLKKIILRAYGYARLEDPKAQQRVVADFANDIALDCYKAQK